MIHLAIDIGASGGRHILGWLNEGKIQTEEMHRFSNGMKQDGEQLIWDIDALLNEIITGLKKCRQAGKIPESVGIDTWGVDFVLLDNDGEMIGPAVAYRDKRTDGMDVELYKFISENELYERTGIQKMFFNTIYQLMAIKINSPQYLENTSDLLFLPDYLHYKLCGVKRTEYTIASTSGLLNAEAKSWDTDILNRCGYPLDIFCEIVPAGTVLGDFTNEVKEIVGFDCKVIMPPSHDTASAFLAVPAISDKSVYISSGTWSLMGVEISKPITTEKSRTNNLTNEGGYDYRYRYIKNIAGLWLMQSVMKEIGDGVDHTDLIKSAQESKFDGIFNVNDDRFASPDSMVSAIREIFAEYGQDEPDTLADFARSIFRSLAVSYMQSRDILQDLTGIEFDCINIIGGGSQNDYINKLTADACGIPVYAGPTEGTALGNLVSQMIAMDVLPDLATARDIIRNSFDIRKII